MVLLIYLKLSREGFKKLTHHVYSQRVVPCYCCQFEQILSLAKSYVVLILRRFYPLDRFICNPFLRGGLKTFNGS